MYDSHIKKIVIKNNEAQELKRYNKGKEIE